MTTAFIPSWQRGQSWEVTGETSVRSARAPQCEQNLAPKNINPKQEGQATVASRAPQCSQRGASVEAEAPHIGQLSVSTGILSHEYVHAHLVPYPGASKQQKLMKAPDRVDAWLSK